MMLGTYHFHTLALPTTSQPAIQPDPGSTTISSSFGIFSLHPAGARQNTGCRGEETSR